MRMVYTYICKVCNFSSTHVCCFFFSSTNTSIVQCLMESRVESRFFQFRCYVFHMKNCIRAMDDTHAHGFEWGLKKIQAAFRNRKRDLSQNVVCICEFDMLFSFVDSGWEGSAHDTHVLMDAISDQKIDLLFLHLVTYFERLAL